jgi:hypothetical protein
VKCLRKQDLKTLWFQNQGRFIQLIVNSW